MVVYSQCILRNFIQRGICGTPPVRNGSILSLNSAMPTKNRSSGHRYSTTSEIPGVRERTLVAVKPDAVQRRLVGQIVQRFEQRGFKLVGLKMVQAHEDLLAQHYEALKKSPFYPSLLRYMTSGPVVAMVWEGHNVVRTSRIMVGETNPATSQPGTLRGDFSIHISRNVVHASDSVEGAEREINLWFHRNELLDWDIVDHNCTYQV